VGTLATVQFGFYRRLCGRAAATGTYRNHHISLATLYARELGIGFGRFFSVWSGDLGKDGGKLLGTQLVSGALWVNRSRNYLIWLHRGIRNYGYQPPSLSAERSDARRLPIILPYLVLTLGIFTHPILDYPMACFMVFFDQALHRIKRFHKLWVILGFPDLFLEEWVTEVQRRISQASATSELQIRGPGLLRQQ
jgi:hypothetical protein